MADGTQPETPDTSKPDAAVVAAPDAKPAEAAPAPDAKAPPEGEKKGEDAAPKTPLEAAQRVMAKEGKVPSDGKPQDGESPPTKADVAAKGEDDEATLPFKNHPAYRKVASENRILQVAKEKNEAAIKALEPKAKTYDDLAEFITSSNLSKDDFQQGLAIMRAVRNDPQEAYKLLQPVMAQLETLVGARLPADLQAKVEAGHIDAETAKELARARGDATIARERAETLQQQRAREEQERAQGEEQRQISTVVDALNAAEAEWTKSDPDAAKLRRMVNKAVLVNGQAKPPRNAEEARALFESSLKEVKDEISGFHPAPRPLNGPLPPGAPPTNAAPVPKNSYEAAQAALASLRR
jgi:hypothetical protein